MSFTTIAKILASLLPKDDLLKLLLFIVLIPIVLISLLFSAPAVIYKRVPIVTDEQAAYYYDASKGVSDSTKSPCFPGVNVNWMEVIALDAVRLNQNFEGTSLSRAKELAEKFIVQTGT